MDGEIGRNGVWKQTGRGAAVQEEGKAHMYTEGKKKSAFLKVRDKGVRAKVQM